MRTPKSRGRPIDARRISSWLERFQGYRVAATEQRIVGWLQHFRRNGDIDLGARVLDAIFFLKSEDIENALRHIINRLPGWHRSRSLRQGRWRFLAFSISAGESGDTILHKSRIALGLNGSRYNKLYIHKSELLTENLCADDNVVFFDDFAGTGEQACRAWRNLAELLPGNPKKYLILIVAGQRGFERINRETNLKVVTRHLLGPGDDIFAVECCHFTQPEKDRLLDYCKIADSRWPRGYGDCGFILVLAHKTPNNSIPILHANHKCWKGLFPRQ
jgi:hypothetical protein